MQATTRYHPLTVERGRRYMFLPFLYDDAAARLRAENLKYLEPDAGRDQDLTGVDSTGAPSPNAPR